jgi:integrase
VLTQEGTARSTRKVKLTDRNVRILPAVNGRTDYTDALVRGFRLRVGPDGSRVYAVGYFASGRWKRYTIGRVGDLTLAGAREAARQIRARARLGGDPQAEKLSHRQVGHTFADLIASFTEKHGPTMRPLSLIEFQRVAKHDILPAFGSRQPAEITRGDIRGLLERILARGARTQAKRTLATVRAVFRWSIREDLLPASADPTFGFSLPDDAKPRDRVYTNDEVWAIFAALPGTELQDLVPLVFYTAVRSEEARAARWADFDLDRAFWTIPAAATKAGDPHPVPLSSGAMRVVARTRETSGKNEFLFPAMTAVCRACGRAGHMDVPNKAISRLRKTESVPRDFRLHDVRRTVATRLAEMGTHVPIIEAILGHRAPKLVRTYQVHAPVGEMRAALERWGAELDRIITGLRLIRAVP